MMSTVQPAMQTRQWGMVVFAILNLIAAVLASAIEWFWLRGWSNSASMYIPVYASVLACCGLVSGLVFERSHREQFLRIEAASAAGIVLSVFVFLMEITPIAQGNNDSGEVFPFIFLPGVCAVLFAGSCLRRLRKLRPSEGVLA